MMEEKLTTRLINTGFKRMDSNVSGIYLFYRVDLDDIKIVSIIQMMSGIHLTPALYEHILKQIKSGFLTLDKPLHLLNIFITNEPEEVKQLCADAKEDSHWIIDCVMNRLIIYETQANDFFGLKDLIEQLLEEEGNFTEAEKYEAFNGSQIQKGSRYAGKEKISDSLQITPVNIIIVSINIMVFILTHFTPFFGSREMVIEKGGLSWYLIKESGQYYRILTSMFMHSDISHLFNNMLVLLFIGGILEKVAGKVRYLIIYFSSGIIAGICSIGYNMYREYGKTPYVKTTFSIGASGAIFGLVGAVLFIVFIGRGKLEQISFRQIVLFVILSLYSGYANSQIDQAAHVGGFLAGLIFAAILYRRTKSNKII